MFFKRLEKYLQTLRNVEDIPILIHLILGDERPNDDETFAVVSSLKKIAYFHNCHDMSRLNIWENLHEVNTFKLLRKCILYSFRQKKSGSGTRFSGNPEKSIPCKNSYKIFLQNLQIFI